MMKALFEKAAVARLTVAEDPKANINTKAEASKDALDGAHTSHRNERDDETETMRTRRRDEDWSLQISRKKAPGHYWVLIAPPSGRSKGPQASEENPAISRTKHHGTIDKLNTGIFVCGGDRLGRG